MEGGKGRGRGGEGEGTEEGNTGRGGTGQRRERLEGESEALLTSLLPSQHVLTSATSSRSIVISTCSR